MLTTDRPLYLDIARARALLDDGSILDAATRQLTID
jgi:hypothetical protein